MTSEGVTGPRKPILRHLRAYGCKAFTLIKSEGDPDYRGKLQKLAPKAHIGYLVGYESTSIYRIWIPYKKKVISTRDVLFNEDEFFDGKPMRISQELMTTLDEVVEKITLPEKESQEDIQLQSEEALEMADLEEEQDEQAEGPTEVEDLKDTEGVDQMDWDPPYPTPAPSLHYLDNATLSLPVKSEGVVQGTALMTSEDYQYKPDLPDIEPAIIDEIHRQKEERFYDFHQHRVPQVWQTAFQSGKYMKDSTPPPQNYRALKGHKFEQYFRASMDEHINEHRHIFNSWTTVDLSEVKGHQILGCQWVFVYKTDKHGRITKCKARLVVRGDQQTNCDLLTRATTLAVTSLRVILAMVAKFDLETLQLDAVNAFVHAELDELIYMRLPPGYTEPGKVLKLNKALYGLRRSPILWQTKITNAMKSLGFDEIPQEPCVMIKDGIICSMISCLHSDKGIEKRSRRR
jgi:hypothetical protein